MTKIDTHMASLTDTITEQHYQVMTTTKGTDLLYKYTHKKNFYVNKTTDSTSM